MRIGFDIDGVLANFTAAYQRLVVEVAGVDRFQPGDITNPPCWNWPEYRGYSTAVVQEVWRRIAASESFWFELGILDGADTLRHVIGSLEDDHDVYFITSRVGQAVKRQTEAWLEEQIGMQIPTVLISNEKALCMVALSLDAYIDDNLDNVRSCEVALQNERARAAAMAQPPKLDTKVFLLDYAYNADTRIFSDVTRVRSVGQMLDYLILEL